MTRSKVSHKQELTTTSVQTDMGLYKWVLCCFGNHLRRFILSSPRVGGRGDGLIAGARVVCLVEKTEGVPLLYTMSGKTNDDLYSKRAEECSAEDEGRVSEASSGRVGRTPKASRRWTGPRVSQSIQ